MWWGGIVVHSAYSSVYYCVLWCLFDTVSYSVCDIWHHCDTLSYPMCGMVLLWYNYVYTPYVPLQCSNIMIQCLCLLTDVPRCLLFYKTGMISSEIIIKVHHTSVLPSKWIKQNTFYFVILSLPWKQAPSQWRQLLQ